MEMFEFMFFHHLHYLLSFCMILRMQKPQVLIQSHIISFKASSITQTTENICLRTKISEYNTTYRCYK